VIVVGGGPVGMTLAIDLATRGIPVIVVERRAAGEPPSVKCNHISSRSMEIYRRLGLSGALRDAGLPADFPNDCSYRITATGPELSRIKIPCRRDRYTATDGPDTWWPTPEPPHRMNQTYMEPVLWAHAARLPKLTLLNGMSVEDFSEQTDGTVVATAVDLATNAATVIRADYLIGCDGGRSGVRKAIGAELTGTSVIQHVQSTYIRAPGLLARMGDPAWMTLALNPRRCGTVVAIDGRETWLIHNHLNKEGETFENVDRDRAIRHILGVGDEFSYEVLSKEDWVGRRLVSDRLRRSRVFLCGDAAHLWMPYAGYGMNAGISDATNLAWLLAAVIEGWGGAGMLDAYEAERLPITDQVSRFAMDMALKVLGQRRAVPETIEAQGPEGDAVRAQIGQAAYDLNVQQYCCGGLNFGYFYDRSPIIHYDGAEPPAYSMGTFTPSTVPGCRAPHLWLADGSSLYDVLGPGYTLFRFDTTRGTDELEQEATRQKLPLRVRDIEATDTAPYDRKLVLVRQDQHIAWRGDALPRDLSGFIATLRGARTS
jgi:2-polyprenyl-6-methoxyphenol hydroxylase-like FAD-dependent oxidoreductase